MGKVNSEQQQRSTPEFLSGGGEMGELIRTYDWASTSLGAVDTWPQSLRTCVRIMLASRQPIWIGWGTEWIKLYNDAYRAIVGGKHPKALGQPAFDVWREIWDLIGPLKRAVMESDQGTYHESQLLIMERNGYPEETYFTFSYTPIPGDDGKTAGMFCVNSDDTERIISERQLRTLTNLGKKLTDCTNTDEIIDRFIETIQENPFDFPFALFHSVVGSKAKLVGATDLDNVTKYVPQVVALDASGPIAASIRLAIETRKQQIFENLRARVGNMPKGAWHVSPDKAIALPIAPPANTELYGIVILGVNPFRLLDEKYMGFISLIADQLQQSFAKVCIIEEERKRALALDEIDHAKAAFFSNISHKFRTPLSLLFRPMQGTLKWLPEPPDEIRAQENESNNKETTILFADDNADARDEVKRLLSDQYSVVVAADGEEAYEKALKHKPDLILTNEMMPRLDGFGLLRRIRANNELRHTQVIFISVREDEKAKTEWLDAGADDYLIMPVSDKELLLRVANHARINLVRQQTEQQFYQLMTQAPALINVFIGPEHRFVLFHPKNKDILGDVDFTGLPLRDTLPELEWQGIFETFDKVYTTGESVEENERAVYVRGGNEEMQERYLNFVYKPWHDLHGNIIGVMNFAVDVTETVIARKKIEESEERFRLLAETLPQLIWTMDGEGELVYASSRWREYTGIDPEPDNWEKIVHPNDLKTVNDAWEKSKRTLRPYRTEVRLRNRNGKYRWFSGQGEPILKDNGEVDRWIGGFTDIHDQKEIEASLERLVAERTLELKRSNESLQQFAHVASHDLKEPVRKIKTFSSRLQHEYGEALPEKGKQFLEKIHSATDRMYAMIEGVLNYSTIDAQDQHTTQVDLNEIIRNIEADLELTMQQKKAVIVKDNLPSIEGASVLLYQLFYNLIGNSLKFASTDRTPVINIRYSDDRDRKYARIELSDNGIGFAPEYSRKIFNTFSRLNPKDQYEGTGLGLALCKKIAERHNGSIQARGEEQEGATFTVLLPYSQLKEIV